MFNARVNRNLLTLIKNLGNKKKLIPATFCAMSLSKARSVNTANLVKEEVEHYSYVSTLRTVVSFNRWNNKQTSILTRLSLTWEIKC